MVGMSSVSHTLRTHHCVIDRSQPRRNVQTSTVTKSHNCYHVYFTDHKRLYEDLHEVAPKWQTFGVHLNVPIDRLQGFQGEASVVERCFTEILVAWLRGEGASCTVEQLVSALRKPGVDQRRLANEIEQNKHGELRRFRKLFEKLGIGLGMKIMFPYDCY